MHRTHTDASILLTATCDSLDLLFGAMTRIEGSATRVALVDASESVPLTRALRDLLSGSFPGARAIPTGFPLLPADPNCVLRPVGMHEGRFRLVHRHVLGVSPQPRATVRPGGRPGPGHVHKVVVLLSIRLHELVDAARSRSCAGWRSVGAPRETRSRAWRRPRRCRTRSPWPSQSCPQRRIPNTTKLSDLSRVNCSRSGASLRQCGQWGAQNQNSRGLSPTVSERRLTAAIVVDGSASRYREGRPSTRRSCMSVGQQHVVGFAGIQSE